MPSLFKNGFMRTNRARWFTPSVLHVLFILILTHSSACSVQHEPAETTIGGQVWMNRNLDTDRYRNGDPVRHAASEAEWNEAASNEEGAWCWYDGDAQNGRVYSKLYNWYAVSDRRGLAPEGWHIPSDGEWQKLVDALGGAAVAGGSLKKKSMWDSSEGSSPGGIGFDALPAGSRNCLGGFFALGKDAFFWSSTPSGDFEAWNREIGSRTTTVRRVSVNRSIGFSVRCVKD